MGKYSISLIYLFLFFLHEMKQISQCNKAAFYWIKLFHLTSECYIYKMQSEDSVVKNLIYL